MGKLYEQINVVIAHLGTGVTLLVHSGGKMIDIVDGMQEGAFSPDRSGGLPTNQLLKLCYSGKYTYKELKGNLIGSGGLCVYFGIKGIREVENL